MKGNRRGVTLLIGGEEEESFTSVDDCCRFMLLTGLYEGNMMGARKSVARAYSGSKVRAFEKNDVSFKYHEHR